MDSAAQAAGERQVRRLLVEPLQRKGLAKPSSLTLDQFREMLDDLCARLAYMTAPGLQALEEVSAQRASGRDHDRFPIANKILEWARDIEPPEESASPLLRAVFSHQVGLDAIDGGYAPELLSEVRKTRTFPKDYGVKLIRDRASVAMRRMREIERAMSRGQDVPEGDLRFRDRRLAAVEKCRAISELGRADREGGALLEQGA